MKKSTLLLLLSISMLMMVSVTNGGSFSASITALPSQFPVYDSGYFQVDGDPATSVQITATAFTGGWAIAQSSASYLGSTVISAYMSYAIDLNGRLDQHSTQFYVYPLLEDRVYFSLYATILTHPSTGQPLDGIGIAGMSASW